MAPLDPRDKALFCSNPIRQLLLSKTCSKALVFQLLSNNKCVALHLELNPFRRVILPEVLRNEVFNWGKVQSI